MGWQHAAAPAPRRQGSSRRRRQTPCAPRLCLPQRLWGNPGLMAPPAPATTLIPARPPPARAAASCSPSRGSCAASCRCARARGPRAPRTRWPCAAPRSQAPSRCASTWWAGAGRRLEIGAAGWEVQGLLGLGIGRFWAGRVEGWRGTCGGAWDAAALPRVLIGCAAAPATPAAPPPTGPAPPSRALRPGAARGAGLGGRDQLEAPPQHLPRPLRRHLLLLSAPPRWNPRPTLPGGPRPERRRCRGKKSLRASRAAPARGVATWALRVRCGPLATGGVGPDTRKQPAFPKHMI